MWPRIMLAGAASLGVLAGVAVPGLGLFSGETVTPAAFSSAADWTGPAAAPVIQKAAGGTPGFLRAGGSYRVYANVSDSGNPASGVAGASADVTAVSAGQSAAALSTGGGPFTVAGTSYAYRSPILGVDAGAGAGTRAYSIASADAAGNASNQPGFTVTVDNTAPAGADIQTANGAGGTEGRPEAGDTVTYTFSEPVDPESILAGWVGSVTDVVVRIENVILSNGDRLSVRDAANAAGLPLSPGGSAHVALGGELYVMTTVDFGAAGTPSRMILAGTAITVTLGTPSGSTGSGLTPGTMTWATSAATTDRAGNPLAPTTVSETGASDAEF